MFELIDFIIVRPITNVLFIVYGFVGDFGLAIILFTLLVKLCMWPIAKRQHNQTKLMRKIQPELAEIKKNCNGNRQLESLQMMDLYKRNNIKPFGSILTLLIQLPIFIALYTAVRVMVLPTTSDNLEKRAYVPIQQFENISEVISLQDDYLAKLGASTEPSDSATDAPTKPEYDFHPKLFGLVALDTKPGLTSWSALILLGFAVANAFVQYWISRQQMPSKKGGKTFRQIMKEAANGVEPDQTELNQVMTGQMSFMMPVMMLLVMINLPGALVFYYFISNLITTAQQRHVLSKKTEEMDIVADKRILKELKSIEEAQIVGDKSKENKHITRITASSKGHKKRR